MQVILKTKKSSWWPGLLLQGILISLNPTCPALERLRQGVSEAAVWLLTFYYGLWWRRKHPGSLGQTRCQGITDSSVDLSPPYARHFLASHPSRHAGESEQGATEDERAGWHHRLYGHEFEGTPGWTGRPGVVQSMGSQRAGHKWVAELNWVCLRAKCRHRRKCRVGRFSKNVFNFDSLAPTWALQLPIIYEAWCSCKLKGAFHAASHLQQGEPCPSWTDRASLLSLTSEAFAAGQFPCLPARWGASRQRLLAASGAKSGGLSGPSLHGDAPSSQREKPHSEASVSASTEALTSALRGERVLVHWFTLTHTQKNTLLTAWFQLFLILKISNIYTCKGYDLYVYYCFKITSFCLCCWQFFKLRYF